MPVRWRQSANAPFDEDFWISRPLNLDLAEGHTGIYDKYSIELRPDDTRDSAGSFDRARHALFRYDIFPPTRMRAHICTPDRRVAAGATIIQRVLLGPVVMEMGVRVIDVVNNAESGRAGFTYATLEGHAERGTATFSIRRRPADDIVFEIESWSAPGNLLAHLGRPVARLTQRTFTREALAHFRKGSMASRSP